MTATDEQTAIPVVCHLDKRGAALDPATVERRMSALGIHLEPDDLRDVDGEPLSNPDGWQYASQTCGYVASIIAGIPDDGPPPPEKAKKGRGRHQWAASQEVRLHCAKRRGCISQTDWHHAQNQLHGRLTELRAATGETVPRLEMPGLRKLGRQRAAAKTDEQARAELGGHTHDGETPDDTDDVTHSGHLGMAIKLAKQFGDKLRYVNNVGWHQWDGKRWARDADGAARRAVHKVIKRDRKIIKQLRLPSEEEEKRLKQIARHESASAITGILTEAAALQVFSITVEDLDADPYLLNCANGTLDLRTMELRPHNPADLITKLARAAYDPDAVGPTWTKSLEMVLPGEDIRAYLRRVIGVALLGKVIEHNLVILTGIGGNGKGTFYKAVIFALGDYADMADPQLFLERKGETSQGEMALRGQRLVVVTESGRDVGLDEARMKRLTGGDIISGRYLYQQQISFCPSHLPLFVTNHLPRVSGDDDAVWRRLRVVPFDVAIPQPWDKHIDEKLEAEADAILTWAIAGWVDYSGRGYELNEPATVLVRTAKYRTDSDDVGRFLDDENSVLKAPTLKATTSQLHAGYLSWAGQEGGDEIGLKEFGRALDTKGFPVTQRTPKARWREGIALRPKPEDDDA